MKLVSTIIAAAGLSMITGCKNCGCDNVHKSDTSEQNRNGENDSNAVSEQPATQNGAAHRENHQQSQNDNGSGLSGTTTGGGVGNADAETGTNETGRNKKALPAETTPRKPGITGTRHTTAKGTGTSSGRQVN